MVQLPFSSSAPNGVSSQPPSRSSTPALSPPSRTVSPSPSSHSIAHRPQPPDSLHSRIRSANPPPASTPLFVDVLSPPSRTATPTPLSPPGTPSQAELPGSGEGGPSADIGIYPDAIYDEYLGSFIGGIRRALVRNLKRESRFIAWHQSWVRNPRLDRYFVYTSLLGTHSFFLIFLPMSFWAGNAWFGRGLVNVLAFGVYFSSAIKDLLCVPRPYSPPCTRLVIGTTHLEYGFLSTHSTNAMGVAFYLYLWLGEVRSSAGCPAWVYSWAWEAMLLYYVVSVVYGRIYAGMHSVTDCVAGSALGMAITWVQWHFNDAIERFQILDDFTVPLVTIPMGLLMVSVHPQPLDDCPCFEDAIAFVAVVMGVMNARWFSARYGILPLSDMPTDPAWPGHSLTPSRVLVSGALSAKPVLDAIKAPIERIGFWSNSHPLLRVSVVGIKTAVMLVIGVMLIFVVRVTAKTICSVVLPPALRVAHDSFGLILPRRHYSSAATEGTAQPSRSYIPAALRRAASPTPQQASSRRRAGSLERTKIRFTLGDGATLPVPFTHPGTHLPGDSLADRMAGAISSEEKERQRNVEESGLKFERPEDRHAEQVRHYDADVLAKVIVYAAIGFAAACPIPLLFSHIGLR